MEGAKHLSHQRIKSENINLRQVILIKIKKQSRTNVYVICPLVKTFLRSEAPLLYVQEVVTQPKILNRTILSNLIHVI